MASHGMVGLDPNPGVRNAVSITKHALEVRAAPIPKRQAVTFRPTSFTAGLLSIISTG